MAVKRKTKKKVDFRKKTAENWDRTIPKSTLTPGGKNKKPARIPSAKYDLFCINYKIFGNSKKASIYAGFAPTYGYSLLRDPKVRQRLAKIDERMLAEAIEAAAHKMVMTREFLDENTMHIIVNGETHFVRGDADRVKALEVGYKAIGAIQPAKITAIAQAGAQAVAGDTMEAVYKSKWLEKKEASLAQKFEEEFQSPPKQLVDFTPPSE